MRTVFFPLNARALALNAALTLLAAGDLAFACPDGGPRLGQVIATLELRTAGDALLRAERYFDVDHLTLDSRIPLSLQNSIRARLHVLAARGSGGARVARNFSGWLQGTLSSLPATEWENAINARFARMENWVRWSESPAIHITYFHPPSPPPQLNRIRPGMSMLEVEAQFDALARRASAPTDPVAVHEVDAAIALRGIPDQYLIDNGELTSGPRTPRDRVYSVGYRGAVNFSGALSSRGGERFYAVLYPRGFVDRYGARAPAARTPGFAEFRDQFADHGLAFPVRSEAQRTSGQAHISTSNGWRIEIDGQVVTLLEFMRDSALGVVEFDVRGNVIAIHPFPTATNH